MSEIIKSEVEVGEMPKLPIKREFRNFELTLDKNLVFGKGDFVLMIQDTEPGGKYFEVYLDMNGRPVSPPMEWEEHNGGERWGTTTFEDISQYAQENFADVLRKLKGSVEKGSI